MKKSALSLLLATAFVFLMSANAVAEGDIGIGGRNCPPNTTCAIEPQTPTDRADDATIFKTVIDYLAQLFG